MDFLVPLCGECIPCVCFHFSSALIRGKSAVIGGLNPAFQTCSA